MVQRAVLGVSHVAVGDSDQVANLKQQSCVLLCNSMGPSRPVLDQCEANIGLIRPEHPIRIQAAGNQVCMRSAEPSPESRGGFARILQEFLEQNDGGRDPIPGGLFARDADP